jgi:DNA-binding GntR family transcriptional regulator
VPATPVDPYGREHAYVQVADDIARRISQGEIARKLPAERAFADEYGVAYTTVRHAMKLLRERDVILTIHGRGTFVAASLRQGGDQAG